MLERGMMGWGTGALGVGTAYAKEERDSTEELWMAGVW